ncbi:hypothetical protein OQA88_974 [Cercophora sp. LCS_1]
MRPKRHSGAMEVRVPEMHNIRRWDGAARACSPWDSLGRDPELWFRNGNCYVHLYGKGQSRRGPAFKVPFDALLEAKCHPLLARFMARDTTIPHSAAPGRRYFDFLDRIRPDSRVELYMPAPPMATKEEALRYHLATRNFFAWVFRRSMVGEHLGSSLIALINSMSEFRCPGEDNMDGLLGYLNEEGYLDMRNQPIHALAILHFAEFFQFKNLYIDAFTHCVGMCDRLFGIPEYQVITSITRKLVRQAKSEMDQRLGHAGLMLRNFLEEDLSEAHVGLTAGARAHLDRFRTFLLAFYTSKLGYYPPNSVDIRSLIFERDILCGMRDDFEALYDYLVDESFTPPGTIPALAQGGICTLQSVHGFDVRNQYPSLQHPLPLLPENTPTTTSRRMSWLTKPDKLKPDQRLVAHAALEKAANKQPGLLKNQLVVAYRKFEEDSIFLPHKADRHEKLSQIDARKIRWILIYATYQVLLSCTNAPDECQDPDDVPYNIAVSTANLPPWKEAQRPVSMSRRNSVSRQDNRMSMSVPSMPTIHSPALPEIKPDIDYLALTHRQASSSTMAPSIPPRCHSLNKVRRSLSIFSHQAPSVVVESSAASRRMSYHEILVQGYGNGTNDVYLDLGDAESESDQPPAMFNLDVTQRPATEPAEGLRPQPLTLRSPSTSSTSSTGSTANSSASGVSSATSVSTAPSLQPKHSMSTWTMSSSIYSQDSVGVCGGFRSGVPPTVPRRSSRRKLLSALHPIPLRIIKGEGREEEAWQEVVQTPLEEEEDVDVVFVKSKEGSTDVWDQFAGVGGLRSVA